MAVTTGITFGCAGLISTLATVKSGYEPSAGKTIGIYAALLISHGLVNTFGVGILKYLNNSSIILHSLGIASFAIAVVAAARTHQSAKFVFSTFYDGTGDPGWSARASPAYVACIGILMSQYTITGERSGRFPSHQGTDSSIQGLTHRLIFRKRQNQLPGVRLLVCYCQSDAPLSSDSF